MTSEVEWRQALAAVHPDGPTPDAEAFIRLNDQREVWRKSQPRLCQWCGVKPIPKRSTDIYRPGKYCARTCSDKARAQRMRKQGKLKA